MALDTDQIGVASAIFGNELFRDIQWAHATYGGDVRDLLEASLPRMREHIREQQEELVSSLLLQIEQLRSSRAYRRKELDTDENIVRSVQVAWHQQVEHFFVTRLQEWVGEGSPAPVNIFHP